MRKERKKAKWEEKKKKMGKKGQPFGFSFLQPHIIVEYYRHRLIILWTLVASMKYWYRTRTLPKTGIVNCSEGLETHGFLTQYIM